MRPVHVTARAHSDIAATLDHLAEQVGPNAAVKFDESFSNAVDQLASFPELGGTVEIPGVRRDDLRILPLIGYTKYVAIYALNGPQVWILRVVDGRRDLASLLNTGTEP